MYYGYWRFPRHTLQTRIKALYFHTRIETRHLAHGDQNKAHYKRILLNSTVHSKLTMRRIRENFLSKKERVKKSKEFFNAVRSGKYKVEETNPAKECEAEPVFLNVYDMISWNKKTMKIGLGIFHAGVEVYGKEYSFHPGNSIGTGVYTAQPRKAGTVMKFREAIPLGTTNLKPSEVEVELKKLRREYHGWEYHVLHQNCCTFSSELTEKC